MGAATQKIRITAEARFDVLECLRLEAFDWRTLKAETEEYIASQSEANRIPWWGCFRADYLDEGSGRRLKLFFYRSKTETNAFMTVWDLKGVCGVSEWTEDAEDDGQIRAWLNTAVENIPEEDDWAVRARVHGILQNTEKTLWDNVLEEVKNAFTSERDKEAAERLAFLQSVCFEFRERKRTRKKNKGG
jgi:hypothetical protein